MRKKGEREKTTREGGKRERRGARLKIKIGP